MIMEILGFSGGASKPVAIAGGLGILGAVGGTVIAAVPAITADTLPVLGAAAGIGIAIVWQVMAANRNNASAALVSEIGMLQGVIARKTDQIASRDKQIDTMTEENTNLRKDIARLEVKLARAEESGSGEHDTKSNPKT